MFDEKSGRRRKDRLMEKMGQYASSFSHYIWLALLHLTNPDFSLDCSLKMWKWYRRTDWQKAGTIIVVINSRIRCVFLCVKCVHLPTSFPFNVDMYGDPLPLHRQPLESKCPLFCSQYPHLICPWLTITSHQYNLITDGFRSIQARPATIHSFFLAHPM